MAGRVAPVEVDEMGAQAAFWDESRLNKMGTRVVLGLAEPQVQNDEMRLQPVRTQHDGNASTGVCPPVLMMPGTEKTQDQDAVRQAPVAKRISSVKVGIRRVPTRRDQWRSRRTRSRLNLATGKLNRCDGTAHGKEFEEMTVAELRRLQEKHGYVPGLGDNGKGWYSDTDAQPAVEECWMDSEHELQVCFEDEEDKPAEILGFSWRSDAETWNDQKWVKVESVVDSGASAPVAPPSMLPGVKIEESEGSKRGQKYTSASKHKLKNLGQQQVHACTEDGDTTDLLFQIADVSKPLVSVSAICERGNRVIFGRAGGVVQNLHSGKQIPFYRRNGIYVLSLWLQDSDERPFGRP